MELLESTDPYLCLNMIVKNEGHIIKDTLTKLLKKVPEIDYWVISDTGSTDETKKIISDFFKERNIKGEIFDDEWKDFGHNRTLALEHAFGKSKYLFIFDADDEICGDFVLPDLKIDSYNFQFGDANGTSYIRTQIINNKKKWKYVGVLHEIITCTEHTNGMDTIKGKYYTISGKSGDRSRDGNKYLKDALILEKAYEEAVKNNDALYHRYGFYCANSYYDAGKWEDAIKWFKITLDNKNWSQEKYISCLRIYNCYNALNEKEKGMFYLVKSFSYDKERAECLYELVAYYCSNDMNEVAYSYYNIVKSFYNERYLKDGLNDKLFLDVSKANLFLPYYMILVSDKVQDHDTTIQMYRIIFTKKHIERNKHYIGNMLYNLQFFIERVKDDKVFLRLFQEYVDFLISIDYPVYEHKFMSKYEKYGIINTYSVISIFKKEEYSKNKKILIYTGYMNFLWNDSTVKTQSIGGAEKAVVYLSRQFPKDYDIYIVGDQLEEQIDNIRYINRNKLQKLLNQNEFHTIIISRYVSFFEEYNNIKCYKLLLYAHDSTGFINNYNRKDINYILEQCNDYVDKVVCLTNWHSNNIIQRHPFLKDKIEIINNGINIIDFPTNKIQKISNKFLWSSCAYRGLHILLNIWSDILNILPDATLDICSYDSFPKNKEEEEMLKTINMYDSITYRGKLNTSELYDLMAKTEYWLYTNTFPETSCITGMEMLMSEVICLYYPLAGLVDTVGVYGIPVERGQEIETIVNLTNKRKTEIRKLGKEYALSCSWENRAKKWTELLKITNSSFEYKIKIINLKRRIDRKNYIIKQLSENNITNYDIFEAIDGKNINFNINLQLLFERNDFNYRKGVIGCALSHIHLWNELINDNNSKYYVILEDDIDLCNNFKQYLDYVCNLFDEQNLEHLALGEYSSKKDYPSVSSSIKVYKKNLYEEGHITFAYIISKSAAIKAYEFINNCSFKCAIDNPQAFGYILNYSGLSHRLVDCKIDNQYGSDIQNNNNIENYFEIIKNNTNNILTVSFCDWWESEYCGGNFDVNNNYFTNLLRKYSNNYHVKIIVPNQNPDILFFSIFGDNHKYLNAKRKVFFSGEPVGQNSAADFNITFDTNSYKNIRLPLWLCYFDNNILEETKRRRKNIHNVPTKEKFCSFIASGPGLTSNRKDFVDKLSQYKTIDCGGAYLNNIGGSVPIGINCSGKVEHNKKYKFAMAFESKNYPGYVTEKICDIFKSNTVPIYWGTSEVVQDFNPKSFINANDFSNFDELVEYIKKVDNDDILYASYFKEPILSNMWIDILTDPNNVFFKNLVDKIIGNNVNLLNEYFSEIKNNEINDNFRNYIFQYGIDSNKKDITNIIVNILESTMQNFVIPIGDNIRSQLFGDPCLGLVKKIFIYNKNYPEQKIIITENESKIIYFDEKYNYKFVMGFYDNGLSERGTTTMMFSYADYAEKYFKCKSIIFYNKHHHANNNEVINRFSNRFDVHRVENFNEIDRIISDKNIKYLYNTCYGKRNSTELVKNCKNLIHAVFGIEPFGDKYSAISDYIVKKSKHPDIDAIPYMIDLPIHNDNMRSELKLYDDTFVIGRIGGYEQFDIKEAHKGIINFLNNANNNNTYFVFVNTAKFYEHPQIIYLDKIVDPYLKVKYINTCNCMIHARSDGETFGLAIAEFSSFNKPIVTCRSDKDNCHLDILGEKAIIFDSETSLINILKDIKNIVNSRDDWNAYKEYTPYKVMKKFMNVFMPEINNSSDILKSQEKINFVDYKIEYGLDDNKIDITHTVISHSLNKEFIEISTNDVLRAELYGDPCWGVVKSIYITTKDGNVTKCKDNYPIILNWQGILIKKPNFKYKLSACLLIKNETENLNDWIQHYINEGVEHFFITSNNSTDGIDNFILNSKYKNMITLITDNSDINIYNDQVKHREILCKNFYNIIKNSTEWCILVDIDEFMYGKNGYTLSSFINTLDEDIGCFYVYWNIFKPTLDSENNISDKFSLKKSCKRINLDLISDLSYEIKFVSKFGKSIFRTSMLQDHTQLWIHKVPTSGKIITNYGNISDYKYDNTDDIYWSESNYTKVNVALNHYAIRNKKDYDNKSSQLENTHRYPFIKGLLGICELDNKYIIEDISLDYKIEYYIDENKIDITYSQASQDVFVINLLQHKKNGYFVEIGTNDPIEGNNTYLLEKNYDFKGLLVEYESYYENRYKQHRPNSIYIIDDARNINYKKVLDDNKFPKNIDYLQIDLDVDNKSTLDTLILLDNTVFDTYKFATVTFEHDIYRGNYFNTREISREIFKKRGYLLVFPDICTDQGCVGIGWQPFEDWYVHPDLIDMNLVNIFKTDKSLRHDYIRDIITNDSKNKPNILKSQEKMKVIFSNFCSVGDIYFSQPFIKNIVENNPENDYYFYHQTSSYYFTDILNIKDINKDNEFKEYIYKMFNFKIDIDKKIDIQNLLSYTYRYDKTNNILLICTWLGTLREKYNTMIECDMISYNKTYKHFINDINKDLNISLIYDDKLSLDVYPCVPKLNIDKYREFKNLNSDKKIIFYYNFLPSSGQQFPVKNIEEHYQIISVLSESNIVVLTSKNNSFIGNKNIYFDLGRGFMSMNKTFIEDNNNNIRIHITNNEYFYNSLNNNSLIPKNYMKLIKVNNYNDIIVELQKLILNVNEYYSSCIYPLFHGEKHFSKHIDETIREYFPDYNYKGVFFEIGAYHPIEISNSYHFEKNGWDCYCFEANPNLIPELKKYRKNVFNYAISNENKDNINFQICVQDLKTCSFSAIEISEDYKNHFFYNPSEIINITVNQKTINSIIENEIQNLDNIDIVSLDIEGGELNCLYGFDLEKYKPKVLIIEDAFNNNILDEYMFKFGYKLDKHISYNKYYVYNK